MKRDINELVVDLGHWQRDVDAKVRAVERGLSRGTLAPAPGVKSGEGQTFSVVNLIRGIGHGDWTGAKREREMFESQRGLVAKRAQIRREMQSRGFDEDTDSKGGFLVGKEEREQLIEIRRANSVIDKLPITNWDNLTGGEVVVPKETTQATAEYIGKNQTIPETDEKFGQVILRPRQLAALVKIPNGLLKRSIPSLETILRNSLMKAMALRSDLAAFKGTGTSNEPRGIDNTEGIQLFDFAGPIQYDGVVDMEGLLDTANVEIANRGWAGVTNLRADIRKVKDSEGRPLFAEILPLGGQQQVLGDRTGRGMFQGWPIEFSTQLTASPSKDLYHAMWGDLVKGVWSVLEFLVSKETTEAFEKNQTHVRVIEENDFGIFRADSFVRATNLT